MLETERGRESNKSRARLSAREATQIPSATLPDRHCKMVPKRLSKRRRKRRRPRQAQDIDIKSRGPHLQDREKAAGSYRVRALPFYHVFFHVLATQFDSVCF